MTEWGINPQLGMITGVGYLHVRPWAANAPTEGIFSMRGWLRRTGLTSAVSIAATVAALVAVGSLAACGSSPAKHVDAGLGGFAGNTQNGTLCGTMICPAGQACDSATMTCLAACASDAECNGGKCCNAKCVTVATDAANCGACGTACTAAQSCVAGACAGLICTGTPVTPTPTPAPITGDDAGTAGAGGSGGAGGASGSGGAGGSSGGTTIGANGCHANEMCLRNASGVGACMCGSTASCPAGQSCSSAGTCSCGTGIGCTSPQTCCGSSCADLSSDTLNCGACGKSCGLGQTCKAGVCGCSTSTQMVCGSTCTDLQSDATHCGACDTACPTGATCLAGKCGCGTGKIACNGVCVDASVNAHCGACDVKCSGKASEPACGERTTGSGKFECLCANTVLEIACGNTCADSSQPDNCGKCGNVCPNQTTCKQDAQDASKHDCKCASAGQSYCETAHGCVDLTSDHDNCGVCGLACLAGEMCKSGTCTCPTSGALYCDENAQGVKDGTYACITANTIKNCYGCGVSCAGQSICDTTSKACACVDSMNKLDKTKRYCAGKCLDTQTDALNCGGCDIKCPTASACSAGKCSCGTGLSWCGSGSTFACIQTANDVNNCGSCGHKCGSGEECCGGTCKNPATAYSSDDANCGMCGTKCGVTCGFPLFPAQCHCNTGTCR